MPIKEFNNRVRLPFEEIRARVRELGFGSITEFHRWHDEFKPDWVGKYPHRSFKKQWISYPDFLGNNNLSFSQMNAARQAEINQKRNAGIKAAYESQINYNWWTCDKCALWVWKLGLKTEQEWKVYTKNNVLPSLIPADPHMVLVDWKGWDFWLGTDPALKMEVLANNDMLNTVVVFAQPTYARVSNVKVVRTMTIKDIKLFCQQNEVYVDRVYWCPEELYDYLSQCINATTTPFMGDEQSRLVPNHVELYNMVERVFSRVPDHKILRALSDTAQPSSSPKAFHGL